MSKQSIIEEEFKTDSLEKGNNSEDSIFEQKKAPAIKIPGYIGFESIIGAVSMLAMRSVQYKQSFIQDMEWLFLPSIKFKQFKVFRNKKNEPIGFINWAKVNEDTEKRLMSGNLKLQPQEWNNGDRLWIINVLAPFGNPGLLLKELQEKEFKDQEVKLLHPKQDKSGLEAKLLKDVIAKEPKHDFRER